MQQAGRPVALVTGGAKRIGAEISRRLHGAGYDLAIHYRHSEGEALALKLELDRHRADGVLLLPGELGTPGVPAALVSSVLAHFGRLDGLVNNASAFFPTPVGTVTDEQWQELFASNARAPFFLAQAATPALRAARGAIVNLVDIHAERGLREHTPYVMAKSALAAMTRSLALELAPEVRVNGVAPGAVLWPEQGKAEAEKQSMLRSTPLARAGTPAEIAEAVRWLLQDASYCTGQILRVDGGRSIS